MNDITFMTTINEFNRAVLGVDTKLVPDTTLSRYAKDEEEKTTINYLESEEMYVAHCVSSRLVNVEELRSLKETFAVKFRDAFLQLKKNDPAPTQETIRRLTTSVSKALCAETPSTKRYLRLNGGTWTNDVVNGILMRTASFDLLEFLSRTHVPLKSSCLSLRRMGGAHYLTLLTDARYFTHAYGEAIYLLRQLKIDGTI